MKPIARLLAFCLSLAALAFFSACTTNSNQALKLLPDGKYEKLNATITGKFSSTKFTGEQVVLRDGKFVTGRAHLSHSNVYVPLIDLEIEKDAEDQPPATTAAATGPEKPAAK